MSVDWTRVRWFRRDEWRDDPDAILPATVYLLDELRDAAGAPIVIHVAADLDRTAHVPGSSHYPTDMAPATAVDFHIVGMPLLDQWLLAERFPWRGIGVYPFWSHPGLHCDLRPVGREHPSLGARWWRDAAGRYRALDQECLDLLLRMRREGR